MQEKKIFCFSLLKRVLKVFAPYMKESICDVNFLRIYVYVSWIMYIKRNMREKKEKFMINSKSDNKYSIFLHVVWMEGEVQKLNHPFLFPIRKSEELEGLVCLSKGLWFDWLAWWVWDKNLRETWNWFNAMELSRLFHQNLMFSLYDDVHVTKF